MWAGVYLYIEEAKRLSSVVSLMACDKVFFHATFFCSYFTTCSKKFSRTCFHILVVQLSLY